MTKSLIFPLFFVTFVVIFSRGEPECPKNIKTTTTLPVKGDCKKFYICSPLGGKVGLSCLNGYNFNPESGICEDENKYNCPYYNESPQPRLGKLYGWNNPNRTTSNKNEEGDDLEVLGRTFFNWFKDGSDEIDPTIFLSAIFRKVSYLLLWPIILPIKKGMKLCRTVFTMIRNLIGICCNSHHSENTSMNY